jgi:hypothetical protein
MGEAARLDTGDWERLLAARLGRGVRVRYVRARTQVARSQPQRDGSLDLRLNGMFADAPLLVQDALSIWLRTPRRARRSDRVLERWIEERLARLQREEPRSLALVARGAHHDLGELSAPLLESEFPAAFDARGGPPGLTWGRAAPSRSRNSLRLGSYDAGTRVVRVHRVLDAPDVPAWFVRYVLFHELLHAAFDEHDASGRRLLHGPCFRARERLYADFARARAWEKAHIDALIRRARRSTP